jgi:hypothetical protein
LAPSSEVPSESVPIVPYEPEPEEALLHQIPFEDDAGVEEIASVPGTADFLVENDVAGAEVTRARTVNVSPIAEPAGNAKVTVTEPATPERRLDAVPNEMVDGAI